MRHQAITKHKWVELHPQENRAWTIPRVPSLGPKSALGCHCEKLVAKPVSATTVTYKKAGMVHALYAEGY